MPEHVHGCLNCRPDMVPDFDRDDPCYHDGEKCGAPSFRVAVDGVEPGYTKGVFEGPEGWILLAGPDFDAEQIHQCPTCTTRDADGWLERLEVCVTPIFGKVDVIHDCPRRIVARAERLAAALKPPVPQSAYLRAMYGEEAG